MKKPSTYYLSERGELTRHIPESAVTILDVGCGAGGLGRTLLGINPKRKLYGIELNEKMAEEARKDYTDVQVGPVEEMKLQYEDGFFDVIIFADVLEHLIDPWKALKRLVRYLKDDGVVISSIPNVAHWSNMVGFLEGKWLYEGAGILDKTHLRFFTRRTVLELLRNAGLNIQTLTGTATGENIIDTPAFRAGLQSLGIDPQPTIDESMVFQYVTVSKKRQYAPKVSVIVWGDCPHEETMQALEALQEDPSGQLEEILLVTETGAPLNIPENVIVIESVQGRGFAEKAIEAIQRTKGEVVCLLKGNIILPEPWLERLLYPFELDSKAAAIGPLYNGESGPQEIPGVSVSDRYDVDRFGNYLFHSNCCNVTDVGQLDPSCILLKKEAYNAVGGFNPSLRNERTALSAFCRSLLEQNYKIQLAQDAFAYRLPYTTK